MPVVFDTNVLVSAAIWPRSVPARAFLLGTGVGLISSPPTLDELYRVLRRPKFNRTTSQEDRLEFYMRFVLSAEPVDIIERVTACRDPKDDKFLELAVNGRATHLVTGDADLLALHPFRDVAILTAADFVAAIAPGA